MKYEVGDRVKIIEGQLPYAGTVITYNDDIYRVSVDGLGKVGGFQEDNMEELDNGGDVAAHFPACKFASLSVVPDEDKVLVSGFSASSIYISPLDSQGQNLSFNWSLPFELNLRASYSQSTSRTMTLCGAYQNFYYHPSIELHPYPNSDGVVFCLSENGTAWKHYININGSEFPFSTNTFYDFKLIYDGEKAVASVSDGINFASEETNVSSVYAGTQQTFTIGGIAHSNNHYAQYVTFDLSKCYIKSNGEFVWGSP